MRLRSPHTRNGRAFTLVELIVVLVILGLLASMGAFAFNGVRSSVNDGKARDLLRSISSAQQAAYSNRGAFVASLPAPTSPGTDEFGNPIPAPTVDRYSDLQQLAPNKYGYTDAETAPTKPMEVSVAKSRAYGSIPVIGLATLSDSGRCVIRATFPLDTGRKALEDIVEKSVIGSCTGANALLQLHTSTVNPGDEVPAAPTNLVVASGPGLLNLSWTAVPQASGYRIYRTAPGQSEASFLTDITGATTYGDYGLKATTGADGATALYSYYVVAYNAKGYGLASATASGTPTEPSAAQPTAPWSLRTTSVDASGVVLTWTPGKNTTSFRVTRDGSPVKNTAGTEVGYLSPEGGNYATTFKDTNIVPGAKYSYRVTGYSASSPGNDQTSTTLTVVTPPTAPLQITATAKAAPPNVGSCGPAACVTLTWPAAPASSAINKAPATGYRLYRCEVSACPATASTDFSSLTPVTTVDTDTLTYTDTGLTGSTDYKYVVASSNSAGSSWAGSGVNVKTVPGAPTAFTAKGASAGKNDLSWTAPANTTVLNYQVWQFNARQTWDLIGTTTGTTWSHTLSGAIGASYKYRVAAVSAAGAGLPSNADTAVPYPLVPNFTRYVATDQDRIELSWPYRNGLSYTLKRIENGQATPVTVVANAISAGSYTDTTVVAGKKYTYTLTASNGTSTTTGASVDVFTPPDRIVDLVATTKVDASNNATQTLNWPAVPGASSYKVYTCDLTDAGKACTNPALLATVSTNSYTRSGPLSVGGALAPAKQYSFAVTAIANGSEGPSSPVANTATTPALPGSISTAYSGDSLVISWDASPLADRYRLVRDSTNPTTGIIVEVAGGTGRMSTTIPLTDATYRDGWGLAAGNDAGWTTPAAYVPPARGTIQLRNMRATTDNAGVHLKWTAPMGTLLYELARCSGNCDPTDPTSPGYVLKSWRTGANFGYDGYDDANVTRPDLYTYAARYTPVDGSADSPWSAPLAVTTSLDAPTGVTVSRNGMGQLGGVDFYTNLVVSWTAVPGAVKYTVYDNGVVAAFQADLSATSVSLGLRRPGSFHHIEVRAVSATGGTSVSSAAVDTYALQGPLDLNLDSVGGGAGTTLSWNKGPSWNTGPENLTTYRVYVCPGTACAPTTLLTSTTASNATDASGETRVGGASYKVVSVNSYGETSPDSNIVRYSQAPAPANFRTTTWSANGPNSNIPTLAWDAATGAGSYRVIDSTGAEVCVTTATSCSDVRSAIDVGTSRSFRVAQINANGWVGAYSSPALVVNGVPAKPAAAPVITANLDNGWSLQWGATANATSYVLYRFTVDPLNQTTILTTTAIGGVITGTTFTDLGPWDGSKTYSWAFRACSAGGCSAVSPISATRKANYRQVALTDADSASYYTLDSVLGTGGWTNAWADKKAVAHTLGGGAAVLNAAGGLVGGNMSTMDNEPSNGVLGVGGASSISAVSGSTTAGDYTLSSWYRANAASGLGSGDLLSLGAPRSNNELSLRPYPVGWTDPLYRTDNGYKLADNTDAWRATVVSNTSLLPAANGYGTGVKQISSAIDTTTPGSDAGAVGAVPLGKHYLRRDFTLNTAASNVSSYLRCPWAVVDPETTGEQTATSRGVSCQVWVDGVDKGVTNAYDTVTSLGNLAAGKHSIAVLFDNDNYLADSSQGVALALRAGGTATSPLVTDSTGAAVATDTNWKAFGRPLTWRSGAFSYAPTGIWNFVPPVAMTQNGSDAYDASGTTWGTAKTASGTAPTGLYWPNATAPVPGATRGLFRDVVYIASAGTYSVTMAANNLSQCDLTVDGGKYSATGVWSAGTALAATGGCSPAPVATPVSMYLPAGYHTLAISSTVSPGTFAAGTVGMVFYVKSGSTFVTHLGGSAGAGVATYNGNNNSPFQALEDTGAPATQRGARVLVNSDGTLPTTVPMTMGGLSSGDPTGGTNLNFARYGGYDPLNGQPTFSKLSVGGFWAQTWTNPPNILDGGWHHLAMIVNNNGLSMQPFIDGVGGPVVNVSEKATKYWAVGHSTDLRAATGPFAPSLAAPAVAPTVSAGVPVSVTLNDHTRDADRTGVLSVGNTWVTTNSKAGDYTITAYDKTTGAKVATPNVTLPAGYAPVSVAGTSTNYYVMARNENFSPAKYYVLRYDLNWVYSGGMNVDAMGPGTKQPVLYANSATVYMIRSLSDGSAIKVQSILNPTTTSGGAAASFGTAAQTVTGTTTLGTNGAAGTFNADVTGAFLGNADFGKRYMVISYANGIRTYDWPTGSATAGRDTSTEWTRATYPGTATSAPVAGLAWDNARIVQVDDRGNVYKYSTLNSDTVRSVQSSWTYDDSEGTGRHETGLSPAASFTQPKRSWLQVTAPAPPDAAPDVSDRSTRYYVDGSRQGDNTTGVFPWVEEPPANGQGPDADPVAGVAPMRQGAFGDYDEVAWFRKAKSPAQLLALFNAGF